MGSIRTSLLAIVVASTVLASCSNTTSETNASGQERRSTPSTKPSGEDGGDGLPVANGDLVLASSFEGTVCGRWRNPKRGCEFGIEGGVETGPFEPRTGEKAVRIDRTSPNHMGVIAEQPLPDGHAFVGVAHRVPELPPQAIPSDPGHLQLEQLSVTDGTLPGMAIEVRLYPDRRLGLALFRGKDVAMTDVPIPVDQWFYIVVEVTNGTEAMQRMWVFDETDTEMAKVEIPLMTRQSWPHENRTAQKVGGSTASGVPLYTYADDWYISRDFRGPLRINQDGEPIDG